MKTPPLSHDDWDFLLKQLKGWYHPSKRKLPWKDLDNAYLVWVSEVFLQQTQADRVVEFWLRFTAKFPRVEDLAKASFEEALPYFKGLGFYGRLRRMLETAQAVVERHGGEFPQSIEELEALPGVGPYTARAVASFAYGQQVLAPDTNVARIISRFFEPQESSAKEKSWVMKRLEFFDDQYPKDFSLNQVLMDFGSQVCAARKPKCEECPLIAKCAYGRDPAQFESLRENRKTRKLEKIPRDFQKIVVGVLIREKKLLVSRRKADQTYSGLLEFPGGKVEEGEDLRAAMQREFREEVGVEVSVRPPFERMLLKRQKLALHFHRCRVLSGEVEALEGQELLWIDQADLDAEHFLPANKAVIEALKSSRL